jgi:hypothetical protein
MITQSVVLRVLRGKLLEAWRAAHTGIVARAIQEEAEGSPVDALRRELAVKREQIESANKQWLALPADERPKSTLRTIAKWEAEAERMEADLVRADAEAQSYSDVSQVVRLLEGDPYHLWDTCDPAGQGLIARALFKDVRIQSSGPGRYSKHEVISYANRALAVNLWRYNLSLGRITRE